MNRDHDIRQLAPWVMTRKRCTRAEAIDYILRYPPEARRVLFRLRFEDRKRKAQRQEERV